MTMLKPAQASGTITSPQNTYIVSGSGFSYYATAANPAAACPGYVVTQVSATRWQCTYTYSSNDGVPPSYWGTQYIIFAQDVSPVCPAHSTGAGANTCTCTNPYVPDAAGTSCVSPPPVCPANMSGTPCVCNAGFVPNPAGPGCILETYTISLVIPPPTEIMAGASKSAYAQVNKRDGAPKNGANVDLFLNVVPELAGQLPVTYTGILRPDSGPTDVDGRLDFEFIAPQAGGTHTITAICTNCTNQATGKIKVSGCPIPPLSAPPFTDPVAQGFENGNRWRPDRLTADYQTKLACVQREITARRGTYTGTSAYRPTEYQRHLYEVIKTDVKLDIDYMLAHPECQALRNQVTREMGPSPGHGLGYDQPVAEPGSSRHESGAAFDLTPSGLTDAQLIEVYTTCHVTHTAVPGEPWHTQ
jgi:hypothetical protein